MVSITCKGIKVTLDDETLCYEFSKDISLMQRISGISRSAAEWERAS